MGLLDRHRRRPRHLADGEKGRGGILGLGVPALVGGAVVLLAVLFALLLILGARPAAAQDLADYDYENLSFQGVMLDVGYLSASRVESTASFGGRVDLGLLGPGVRVTAGFNRWSSFLVRDEVRRLEVRMEELVREQGGPADFEVALGDIRWSDVALHGDIHFLWHIPFGLLGYAGLGGSAHILRGGGAAIEDTFVEDLLNSIRAGLNVHGGFEIPVHDNFRVVTEGRFELLQDLRYFQVRLGGQVNFNPPLR